MKPRTIFVFTLMLLVQSAAVFCMANPPRTTDTVVRVVDGDTVILRRIGRARLLGVDSPESVRPGFPSEKLGRESADFTRERLVGETVQIEFDGEKTDRYGRSLVYVFMGDGTFFNEELVRYGYAIAYTGHSLHYAEELLRGEDEAWRLGRGLWSERPLPSESYRFHGNRNSHVYHSPNCESYNCPNCRVMFPSRVEAEKQGFRPHIRCVMSR